MHSQLFATKNTYKYYDEFYSNYFNHSNHFYTCTQKSTYYQATSTMDLIRYRMLNTVYTHSVSKFEEIYLQYENLRWFSNSCKGMYCLKACLIAYLKVCLRVPNLKTVLERAALQKE